MEKQVHIKKGQESSRLSVLYEFFPIMKGMFETIKKPPLGFFDDGHTSVSKGNYKITLIIEEIN